MKTFGMALGLALLIAAVAVPAFAYGPGYGWDGGYGPGYYHGYGPGYSNLTPDQLNKLNRLNQKFYNEATALNNDIWAKSDQLDALLNSPNPDSQNVKALQKEIGDLRAKLAERRVQYNSEAQTIVPGAGYAVGYGRGYYGPWMGGGPGYCWNY